MALIVNLMRDPKKNKPVKAEDFNPYTVKEKASLKAPLSVLRDVFCQRKELNLVGQICFCNSIFR